MRYQTDVIIIMAYQSDQDQVYDNRYQTETPVVTLTTRSRSKRGENWPTCQNTVLGITIDSKLPWDSHTNNVWKAVSRQVFLLSKLRYIVDIDKRKLFFNAHIKPHIDCASVVWDGCSDALKRRLNSLHRRAVKLILRDTAPDQKLKEMRIMSLQKQLEYNKGLFMYRVLSNEVPEYISNLYTHTPSRYCSTRNYHLSLPRPRIDIQNKYILLWCLSVEQLPTSDSQILSVTHLLQA